MSNSRRGSICDARFDLTQCTPLCGLVFGFLFVVGIFACGGSLNGNFNKSSDQVDKILSLTANLQEGENSFRATCGTSSCHGSTGNNGTEPMLGTLTPTLSDRELLEVMILGKGRMAGQGLSNQGYRNVLAYVRELFPPENQNVNSNQSNSNTNTNTNSNSNSNSNGNSNTNPGCNPSGTQAQQILCLTPNISNGQSSFSNTCGNQACHGSTGNNGPGPQLSSAVHSRSDQSLLDIMISGRGSMPGQGLSNQTNRDVLGYLRQQFP